MNTTVSGNYAFQGGGIWGDNILATNCTITGNVSEGGRSGGVAGSGAFMNCIVAGNTAQSGADFDGRLISLGYNLIQDTNGTVVEGNTTGTLYGIDPRLGPLQNNGGLTPTHALLPDSPAIDAGSLMGFPLSDQRGVSRPWNSGAGCGNIRSDIGAYEAENVESARICSIEFLQTGQIRIILSALPHRPYTIQSAASLVPANWVAVASGNTDQSGLLEFLDVRPVNLPSRFYRAVTQTTTGSIIIPATSGVITSPFIITNGYIYQPTQTTVPANGGRAAYNFTVATAGNYVVHGMVNAPHGATNSFFVNIDAEPQTPYMIWDIRPLTSGFEQRTVSWVGNGTTNSQFVPKVFTLGQGPHQLIIRGREMFTMLQSVTIAPSP